MNGTSDRDLTLQFLGGAETVTGSKILISFHGRKILIDCGLFQGLKKLRLQNWGDFPVPPREIDAVILTHAHLDHSGYLPKLIKEGFRGRIFATPMTLELCRILLPDSGFLMEEEARYLTKEGIGRHHPAEPLYTLDDARRALERFQTVGFHERHDLGDGWSFEFLRAGHILGAAMVVLTVAGRRLVFSGDVGRLEDPILRPPEPLPNADVLILESTYGNKLHREEDILARLEELVRKVTARGGVLVVPAFAVGRAQLLMALLAKLKEEGRLPEIPIYLNSPMATSVTGLLHEDRASHRLSAEECRRTSDIARPVKTAEDSKALNTRSGPMIIISASGMMTGGRVLHHLKAFAPDPKNAILLTGFQAAGTRGRALLDGAKELKIHGAYVPVRAEVVEFDSLSAHADYGEMTRWLENSQGLRPRRVFLTHGEPAALDEWRRRLSETFAWDVTIPGPLEKIRLS